MKDIKIPLGQLMTLELDSLLQLLPHGVSVWRDRTIGEWVIWPAFEGEVIETRKFKSLQAPLAEYLMIYQHKVRPLPVEFLDVECKLDDPNLIYLNQK